MLFTIKCTLSFAYSKGCAGYMFGIRIRRIIHYPAVSGSGGYFYIRIRRYPESPDTGIYRIPVSPHPNISELFESTLNLCIYTQR